MTGPTILILGAGRATRMRGVDKLLEPLGGDPLLRVMARRAVKAAPTRVVLGPDQPARQAALEGVNVTCMMAPADAGMAASIVAGVAGLSGPVLIMLADMPEITAYDLHLLITLSAQAPDGIFRSAGADGTPGHPVLFPADLLPDLSRLTGDTGAASVLKAHAARVHLVPLKDRRAVTDLDTPEDWAAWRARNPLL